MTKDKIIFFTSGDFAIETFTSLLENHYNIVGLVTSADNVKFHDRNAANIAREYNIPVCVLKANTPMENDGFFMDWLKRKDADVYCVISFKKLPNEVIKLAKKCAFNVHASLLPLLRGAAPINWAIRLGYEETGLTAFVLNDKIDCGDIIANTKVKIRKGDKFTTLFNRLANVCVDFTKFVIDDVLQRNGWENFTIKQPSITTKHDFLTPANKINHDYFKCHWTRFSAEDVKRCVDSVDDTGFECKIVVMDDKTVKDYDVKVYGVEAVDDIGYENVWTTESDGKTYIKYHLSYDSAILVKKIQIAGKKVMDVQTFLNGFRYFRDKKYLVYLMDLVEYNSVYDDDEQNS